MASDEEIKTVFEQFKKANSRLKEAMNESGSNPLKQDAVIQRFEFTYELLWKTFKKISRFHKMDCFSPRDCFKFAFRMGLIEDEKIFIDIIDARNKTTHLYSEDQIRVIFEFIRDKVIQTLAQVEMKIEQSLIN